jgi:energy-converting hydrogenase Eha subunit H
MCILIYLEGLIIAIVSTQLLGSDCLQESVSESYKVHRLMNQPENAMLRYWSTILYGVDHIPSSTNFRFSD